MPPEIQSIPALGVEPCSADAPAGVNIQDDLDFDQLQNDVNALVTQFGTTAEMQAIGEKDPPTWEKVSDKSFAMLKDKSKDIRLASFLTIAMVNVRGFEGLRASLEMLHGLLKNFWDTMYPPVKLLRGRVNALDFIGTQVSGPSEDPGGRVRLTQQKLIQSWEALEATNPTADAEKELFASIERQTEALRGCAEAMTKLRELIYEKFPADKLPSVSSLTESMKRSLAELEDFVKRNKRDAGSADAQTAAGSPAAASAPAASAATAPRPAAGGAAGALDSAEDARKLFARCAPLLRQADPTDPAAYRLNRWGAWRQLTTPPPTTDGKKTRIPDVQKGEVDQTRALLAASNWLQLLNQSEDRFAQTPLWLDRQYFIYSALGGLGPAYRAAQEAVRDELAQLLRRLPGLEQLSFAGGLAFADASTLAWIQGTVLAGPVASGGGNGAAPAASSSALLGPIGGGDEGLDEALEEARGMMHEGRLAEALRALQDGSMASRSARARFLWRLAQAQLATDAGKGRQMLPVWESLLDQIDLYRLDEWDPDLCLPVLHTLWRLLRGEKEREETALAVLARLCRLDPAAAIDGN